MKITFLVPPPIDGKIPERVSGCAYLLLLCAKHLYPRRGSRAGKRGI